MSIDLTERLASGARLTDAEAQSLLDSADLTLGMAATEARQKRHGDRVTFLRVADFWLDDGPPSAAIVPPAAGELRITGTPQDLGRAVSFVAALAAVASGRPVSGFSLADLEALADWSARPGSDSRASLVAVLTAMRAAGLEFVAEAPIDRLRDPLAAVDAAREAGVGIARVTIHHAAENRLARLREVMRLQDQIGTLRVFAPLPRVTSPGGPTTGYDDVRQVALARLLVDNIDTIQVDWALYGPKLAQVALTFGANDVDAVSPLDTLDLGLRRAPLEIRRNIRAAALIPVERSGRFQVVTQ